MEGVPPGLRQETGEADGNSAGSPLSPETLGPGTIPQEGIFPDRTHSSLCVRLGGCGSWGLEQGHRRQPEHQAEASPRTLACQSWVPNTWVCNRDLGMAQEDDHLYLGCSLQSPQRPWLQLGDLTPRCLMSPQLLQRQGAHLLARRLSWTCFHQWRRQVGAVHTPPPIPHSPPLAGLWGLGYR